MPIGSAQATAPSATATPAAPAAAPAGAPATPATPAAPAAAKPGAPPAAAPKPGEPAKPAGEPEKPKDGDASDVTKRFQDLARKEREIQKEKTAAAELKKKYEPVEQVLAKAKEKPLEALKALGLTVEQIVRLSLADGEEKPKTEVEKLRDDLAAVQEAQKKLDEERATQSKAEQKKQYDTSIAQAKKDVETHVAGKAADFPMVKSFGKAAVDQIVEAVEAHFMETAKRDESGRIVEAGELWDLDTAVRLAEGSLRETYPDIWAAMNPEKKTDPAAAEKSKNSLAAAAQAQRAARNAGATGTPKPQTLTPELAPSSAPRTAPPRGDDREARLARARAKLKLQE